MMTVSISASPGALCSFASCHATTVHRRSGVSASGHSSHGGRARLGALIALLLLVASPTFAQSAADCTGVPAVPVQGVSPTPTIKFTASVSHDVLAGITPILSHYAIAVCSGSTMVSQANLGKPTPAPTTREISMALPTGPIQQNQTYYLVVYSVGPFGSNHTGPVVPFVVGGRPVAVPAGSVTIGP